MVLENQCPLYLSNVVYSTRFLPERSRKMFSIIRSTQYASRLAIIVALTLTASFYATCVNAQVAGFASSRPDLAGQAESGPRRVLNLNPFKSSTSDYVDQTPFVQPISSSVGSSPASRSRQLATESETRVPARSRNSVAVKSLSKRTSQKKLNSSSGVAVLLLDELEEDFEDSFEKKSPEVKTSTIERRSLRERRSTGDLELLEEDVVSNDELIETDDNSFDTTSSDESSWILSTDDDNSEADFVVEMGVDDNDDMEVEVSRLNDLSSVGRVETTGKSETLEESLDSHFDSYREGTVLSDNQKNKMESGVKTANSSSNSSPLVEIETIGPKKLIVGQESVYNVVVRNNGSQVARQLVVTTDLPDSVVASSTEVQVGSATIVSSEDGRTSVKHCVWNVGTLAPKQERTLALKLTPTKRVAFELVSNFEYERPAARADVEVQEPILEALIEGRDSIEWGVEDKFRLRLRNVGNGDAENVELFVSTGENKATQKLGLLKAGEEKTIETSIKTVADDFFVIEVDAVASYGIKTSSSKKIGVLRGKLDVEVEAPELQFVEGEFDAKIYVRNSGDAPLQHVDVVAQIPEGIEAVFCSNQARQNTEKRRIYWSAPFLRPNEETVFTASCRVTKAGIAKFEVVGVDQTGLVAQAESLMNIESIAVLAMRIKAPKEPVAVGKRCTYELIVENNGTKDALDVNSGVFLGTGMRPISVEGEQGVVFEEESKVLFNKIDCLKAGESIVFRLEAEAMAPGNQKVQAMLQSSAEDVSLLSEETTYCYSRAKKISPTDRDSGFLRNPTITADKNIEGTIRK